MEKIETKIVCDFCGVECEREEYVFPTFETESLYAKNGKGQKLLKVDKQYIVPKQVDMCPNCKIKVAQFIDLAHYVDIHSLKERIYDAAMSITKQ